MAVAVAVAVARSGDVRMVKYMAAGGIAALMVLSGTTAGASTTTASLQSRVLALSDLPTGWEVSPTATTTTLLTQNTGVAVAVGNCASTTSGASPGTTASVTFDQNPFPKLGETLGTGTTAVASWNHLNHVLKSCRVVGIKAQDGLAKARIRPLAFPQVGDRSSAHLITAKVTGVAVGVDVVTFKVSSYVGVIAYISPGRPNAAALKPIVRTAVAKAAATTTATTTSATT